ncbi:MAG: RIP metalloprotease RseP [Bacteroidetes bacterium]|nr:RIP metalloprotease RseP [Bacteroidota bacterium]MBU2586197.1 RIP metalloprotease RseP [Bacteroidota bacterium]
MELFNSIFYFVLTIGILIAVHEFGHFIAAKLSKMRVNVFAIGFGLRLFGYNKLKGFTFGSLPKELDLEGNTDYRLCILPLGGYVKVAGMIDESLDREFLNNEPQPWEFRSKSTGKKLFVISAGVIMNVLLAFLIFWGVNIFKPIQHLKTTEVGYIPKGSTIELTGFKQNDKIISIDGKEVVYWDEILNFIFIKRIGEDFSAVVERDGKLTTLNIKSNLLQFDRAEGITLLPKQTKVVINQITSNSPAEMAGLQKEDMFISLNNERIISNKQLIDIVSSNAEKSIPMVYARGKDTISTNVAPNKEGKIGVLSSMIIDAPVEYESYSFFSAGIQAMRNCYETTLLFFNIVSKVILGKVEFAKAFGGPIRIAQMAAQTADVNLFSFINFIALLSLSLAIINILPFPVLDGGHIIIILLEGILQREIPPKVKIAIQNVGFVILLLFMAFVIYTDIMNF